MPKAFAALKRRTKHWLAKSVNQVLGPVQPKERFDGPLHRIAILAQERLGDAILLTPLLGTLRRALPDVEIHIITVSPEGNFFENDPNVTAVHRVKTDYFRYFRTIRRLQFDVLFNTKDHPSFTFLYQSRLVRARFRVGIAHAGHQGFYHHLLPLDLHRHIIEKNCALLDYLGITYRKQDCRPYLPPQPVSSAVQAILPRLQAQPTIGINLSAGEKSREWPLAKWREFIRAVRAPMVVFAMADRRADKIVLEEEFSHVIATPPTRNIFEAGQIIRHLQVLVSPDTALVHVAACYNTPVAGLYRAASIHRRRFRPYGTPYRQLVSKTETIADIPVAAVLSAVEALCKLHAEPALSRESSP